jgi:hypothetical protein
VVSDILATHRRLVAAGLSDEQSKGLLRLIAEAESGSFDRRAVQDHLAAAEYGAAHVDVLVEVLLQRLARNAGATP